MTGNNAPLRLPAVIEDKDAISFKVTSTAHLNVANLVLPESWQDITFHVSARVFPLVTCLGRDYDQLTDIEIAAGRFFQQPQQQGSRLDTHTVRKHRNEVVHHFCHSEVTLSRKEPLVRETARHAVGYALAERFTASFRTVSQGKHLVSGNIRIGVGFRRRKTRAHRSRTCGSCVWCKTAPCSVLLKRSPASVSARITI